MKYCSSCGAELVDQAVVCPKCGVAVAGSGFGTASIKLKTNRGLLKTILLSAITLGIYSLVVFSQISEEINLIASKYDGKKTMHFCLVTFVFSWLTCGIVPIVWITNLCSRMGNELKRRGISYSFGAGTLWGWGILGSLIIVGPFIYGHKFFKAMNLLAEDFNAKG